MLYNLILYNYRIKRLVVSLLKLPLLYKNPLYSHFYHKQVNRQIKKYQNLPRRVMIENTNICNAGCVFCPHKIMKRKTGVMDMKLYEKIISDCKQSGVDFVTIYGFGEPLLDKDFVKKVRIAKKAGIKRITTNTNANFLTEKIARELVDLKLDEIYISFDAASKKTYSKIRPNLNFDKVERNIKNLVQYKKKANSEKPEIILSFVKTDTNKDEVQTYIDKWQDLVQGISISELHNWTGDIKGLSQNKGLKEPCRLLWTDMVISWDGKVPLCCNDYENKNILGDIKKSSIRQIWGGKKLKAIRKVHKNKAFNGIDLCKNCEYNYHHKSPWWVEK